MEKNSRSFCFIDDFVKALNLIIKKGKHKEIYNIGNEEEIKIIDLTKLLIKLLKKDLKIIISSKSFYNANRRLPDLTKLKKLGYKPKINLNKGLNNIIDWYKKNHKKL